MYMKAGDLKKALENVPDDAEVRVQRIEDVYFSDHGWDETVKKLIFDCYGQFHYTFDKDGHPVTDLYGRPVETGHADECYSEYIEVFSAYLHPDENVFVLNPHY